MPPKTMHTPREALVARLDAAERWSWRTGIRLGIGGGQQAVDYARTLKDRAR